MVQGEGETERSVFMKKASGKTEKKWTMPELISRYCDSGEMQDDFTTSALEYYKSIEQMEEGICFIDTKKIVKIWNRAIEGIYNIKADEILGRPLDAFFFQMPLIAGCWERKLRLKTRSIIPAEKRRSLLPAVRCITKGS